MPTARPHNHRTIVNRLAKVADGVPTVLVSHGRPLERVMRKSRVELDDVLVAARQQGLRLGTWPVCITHQSGGNFSTEAWKEKYRLYREKWPD